MSKQILNVHVEWIEPYDFKCFVPRVFDVDNLGTRVVGKKAVKLLKSLNISPDSFEQLHNINYTTAVLAYMTFERLLALYEQQYEHLNVTLTLYNSQHH